MRGVPGHWTPTYLFDRVSRFVWEKRNPEDPWLPRAMVEILASWLADEDHALEWGSGRSTVWFSLRVAKLFSVEHDPEWRRSVNESLEEAGTRSKVDLLAREVDRVEEYVGVVDLMPDDSLDLVLVDGRHRDLCAVEAVKKIKPGGIVVVDDVQRYLPGRSRSRTPGGVVEPATATWERFATIVEPWRSIRVSDGIKEAALWVRPQGGAR